MNAGKRIQALRPHRQKGQVNSGESSQCAQKWCNDELAAYVVIIVIISFALWESWSRKDPYR